MEGSGWYSFLDAEKPAQHNSLETDQCLMKTPRCLVSMHVLTGTKSLSTPRYPNHAQKGPMCAQDPSKVYRPVNEDEVPCMGQATPVTTHVSKVVTGSPWES